jgi:hypothetical protein
MNTVELGIYNGEKLREAQRASGFTVVALAEAADISRESLFAYMGEGVPRVDVLAVLCLLMAEGKAAPARRMFLQIAGLAPRSS